jgi:hypothetical protein
MKARKVSFRESLLTASPANGGSLIHQFVIELERA